MFGRSKPEAETAEADVSVSSAESAPAQGKGRPTPKRKEAEAARKTRAAPPKDKKEARARMREDRMKERQQVQEALESGDEKHYPVRDRGKPKALARNWVDGRRNVGEFFWPFVIAALVCLLIPIAAMKAAAMTGLLAFYVVIITDTAWSLLGLRSALARYIDDPAQRRGVLPYAFGRSLQNRRKRKPIPKVSRGWTKQLRRGEVKPF